MADLTSLSTEELDRRIAEAQARKIGIPSSGTPISSESEQRILAMKKMSKKPFTLDITPENIEGTGAAIGGVVGGLATGGLGGGMAGAAAGSAAGEMLKNPFEKAYGWTPSESHPVAKPAYRAAETYALGKGVQLAGKAAGATGRAVGKIPLPFSGGRNVGQVASQAAAPILNRANTLPIVQKAKEFIKAPFFGQKRAPDFIQKEADISKDFTMRKAAATEAGALREAEAGARGTEIGRRAVEAADIQKTGSEEMLKQAEGRFATAGHKAVVGARPQYAKVAHEISEQGGGKLRQAIAGKEGVRVPTQALAEALDQSIDPSLGGSKAALRKLGLIKDVTDASGKVTEQVAKDVSLGELLDKRQALRRSIPYQTRSGQSQYTPDHMLTDDMVEGISDVLDQNGVDLTDFRQFWSTNAPNMRQARKIIHPFGYGETETKVGAKFLGKAAREKVSGTHLDPDERVIYDWLETKGVKAPPELIEEAKALSSAERTKLQAMLEYGEAVKNGKHEVSRRISDAKILTEKEMAAIESGKAEAMLGLKKEQDRFQRKQWWKRSAGTGALLWYTYSKFKTLMERNQSGRGLSVT